VRLLSSLTWNFLRFGQIFRRFAGAIWTSGATAGLNYAAMGFKSRLRWLLDRRRGSSKALNEFDRKWGTDTSARVRPRDLGVNPRQAIGASGYLPTGANRFRDLISRLNISFGDYVFVDIGSGKGLVLLLASQYPFKRVVGVEFSPVLHKVAGTNLSKNDRQIQRCFDIELVCMDATKYEFPKEPCVVYFYNPFAEEGVMQKVLDNLLRSLTVRPRDLIIIYLNPTQIKCFETAGGFQRLHEIRFSERKEDLAVILRAREKPT